MDIQFYHKDKKEYFELIEYLKRRFPELRWRDGRLPSQYISSYFDNKEGGYLFIEISRLSTIEMSCSGIKSDIYKLETMYPQLHMEIE